MVRKAKAKATEDAPEVEKAPEPVAVKTVNGVEITPDHLSEFGGDFIFRLSSHKKADPRAAMNASLYNLGPGDVVLKLSPESEFQFGTIDDGSGHHFTKTRINARRDGWEVCMADDWYLSEMVADIFMPDPSGRLVLDGETRDALVLYARSRDRAEEKFAYDRRWVDDIGKSYEEKMAENREELARAGIRSQLSDETLDATGGVLESRISRF